MTPGGWDRTSQSHRLGFLTCVAKLSNCARSGFDDTCVVYDNAKFLCRWVWRRIVRHGRGPLGSCTMHQTASRIGAPPSHPGPRRFE